MTRKPVLVLAGMVLQTGMALLLSGAVGLFSFLIYSIRNSATPSQGLKLALFTLLPLAVTAVAASWGMWRQRVWGWWMALVLNVLVVLTTIPDLINGHPDLGDFAGATFCFACLTLLLPTQVRRYFLRQRTA